MAHVWHITYDGPLPSSALVSEIHAEATDLVQRHTGLRQTSVHIVQRDRTAGPIALRVAFSSDAGSFLVTRSSELTDEDRLRRLVRNAFAAAARLLVDHRERERLASAA